MAPPIPKEFVLIPAGYSLTLCSYNKTGCKRKKNINEKVNLQSNIPIFLHHEEV
jgi:hypothetical protein